MNGTELHSYPPESDPDARYRAIVERGAALRRRRTLGTGAGIAASLLVVALAVVVLNGTGPDDSQVVASEGTTPTTAAPVDPTPADPAPTPEPTTDLQVRIDDDPALRVVVTDPIQPALADAQQCVLVQLLDGAEALAEGFGCSPTPQAGASDPVELVLRATNGVSIGCAATVTRAEPDAEPAVSGSTDTREVSSTFDIGLPEEIAAGSYTIEVSATSGVGDGCAGASGDPAEPERDITVSDTVTVD